MVYGSHLVLYSEDAEADRAFFRDVLGFDNVDAGQGWLVFALPSAELGVHPAASAGLELFLMCDDLDAEMASLASKGVECAAVEVQVWGRVTSFRIPGGASIGLYQPSHPSSVAPDPA